MLADDGHDVAAAIRQDFPLAYAYSQGGNNSNVSSAVRLFGGC